MKFSLKNLKKQLIVTWGFSYVLVISIMLIAVIMISIIYNNTSKKYLNEFNDYIFGLEGDDYISGQVLQIILI